MPINPVDKSVYSNSPEQFNAIQTLGNQAQGIIDSYNNGSFGDDTDGTLLIALYNLYCTLQVMVHAPECVDMTKQMGTWMDTLEHIIRTGKTEQYLHVEITTLQAIAQTFSSGGPQVTIGSEVDSSGRSVAFGSIALQTQVRRYSGSLPLTSADLASIVSQLKIIPAVDFTNQQRPVIQKLEALSSALESYPDSSFLQSLLTSGSKTILDLMQDVADTAIHGYSQVEVVHSSLPDTQKPANTFNDSAMAPADYSQFCGEMILNFPFDELNEPTAGNLMKDYLDPIAKDMETENLDQVKSLLANYIKYCPQPPPHN